MKTDTAKDYYLWQPPDKKFSIYLEFSVIDRMSIEVMRGFGAVRRRGAEVGGILLGRIETGDEGTVVTIEDFEPVGCEYAFGPSYILSQPDLQRFRKSLAEHDPSIRSDAYTVGYYRSHTRDGLALDDQDVRFFREYFPDPLHVLLLIKPFATKASVAGFFFQESGTLQTETTLEFPFRRRELGGGASPNERPERGERHEKPQPKPTPEPVPVLEPLAAPRPVERAPVSEPRQFEPLRVPDPDPVRSMFGYDPQTPPPSPWKKRLGWAALVIALLALGLAVGTQFSTHQAINVPGTATSGGDPYSLNLRASRVDDNILVKWDKDSAAVKNASKGLLTITEGPDSKAVQMDPAQLMNGSVLYRHVAPLIVFKLEVFVKEQRSIVETLRWELPADSKNR